MPSTSSLLGVALVGALVVAPLAARGQEPIASPSARSASAALDHVVARWYAQETGGVARPQFIFARELAFEARVEALASADSEPGLYRDRHVRAAMDRHIAETLLASLPIVPAPSPQEIASRAEAARGMLEQRVNGRPRLLQAAVAEGLGSDELDALLRRQARASLYLDRMVAPMLEPSEFDLRSLWRTRATPFKDQPYDQIAVALRRWYVSQRLAQAIEAYYQSARPRVTVVLLRELKP